MKALFVVAIWIAASLAAAAAEPRTLFFGDLASFDYDPQAPEKKGKVVVKGKALDGVVPELILSQSGKAVEIAGYMLPLALKGDKVEEFLLLPDTMACCYGSMPKPNEFVLVRMRKGVNLFENVPLRVSGKLKVEETWENGYFSHLYFLEGQELKFGFGEAGSPVGL